MDDLYRTLQVDPIADPEVIEAAYRQLARKYHPDVYKEPDAHRRMQALNDAFAVLRDPMKRAGYDRQRAAAPVHAGEPAMGVSPAGRPPPPRQPAAARGVSAALRREKITELNSLVQRLEAEQHAYAAERSRGRTALGVLYLVGATVLAILTAALAPGSEQLPAGSVYAVVAAAGLLAVLGVALIARAAISARGRRAMMAHLRKQIKARRQDLSRR